MEDARLQKRLHQIQDVFVTDPFPHPTHKGWMRNFVETGFDVALHDPLIGAGREMVHLGHRVMSPAVRVSRRGDSHPPPLSGPDVTISRHPAPTVRPEVVRMMRCQ
jgi:hypothetical protein